MNALLVLSAAVILAAAPAAKPERFRLVNRVHGDVVRSEWNEITPDTIRSAVDGPGGMKMWEFTIEVGTPIQARSIEARVFSLRETLDHPATIWKAEHVGNELRRTYTDVAGGKPPQVTSEPWPEDAIFLPRGLLGYELLVREALARGMDQMSFTWLDPLYKNERGSLQFVKKRKVLFHFEDSGDAVDEVNIDDKGHVISGAMGIGGQLGRGQWLPEAERKREPSLAPRL